MRLNDNLRREILSTILGTELNDCDGAGGSSAQLLTVDDFHLGNILGKSGGTLRKNLIDLESFFDREFDFDYTSMTNSLPCERGNESYLRPSGWYRIALKVKGKYPDGDEWLGSNMWRRFSDPGEWPVSFHGTSLDGVKGIITGHYKAGPRQLHGRGIYSTPKLDIAEKFYAKTFRSKSTGKSYKVILQNRVNPAKREICSRDDYWLIPIPSGTSAEKERTIVRSSIRPYGILIKEISSEDAWTTFLHNAGAEIEETESSDTESSEAEDNEVEYSQHKGDEVKAEDSQCVII